VWREEDLELRKRGTKDNQVAVVGWRRAAPEGDAAATVPSYGFELPEELAASLTADSLLVMSLADTGEDPPEDDKDDEEEDSGAEDAENEKDEDAEDEEREARDFSIELATAEGLTVALPLSRFGGLPKPLHSRFLKLPAAQEEGLYGNTWELTLQLFELPLSAFAAENPAFEADRLRRIRLVFDRSEEGVVVVDDVGFAESGGGRSAEAAEPPAAGGS